MWGIDNFYEVKFLKVRLLIREMGNEFNFVCYILFGKVNIIFFGFVFCILVDFYIDIYSRGIYFFCIVRMVFSCME